MAVIINIATEFAPKGIKRAIREFKQLETNAQRASWIMKKALKGMTFAVAGLAGALAAAGIAAFNLAKGAAQDQASAALLARQLRKTTGATNDQVKAVEDWIGKLQIANGIADTELRPSLAKLVRATKSVSKAQTLLQLALDISAGSGRDVDSVVTSLVRAYNGNFGGLQRLGIALDKTAVKSKDFKKIQEQLAFQFGGASATKAATFDGKMRSLGQIFDELKEKAGYALLKPLQKLADIGIAVATAFGEKGAGGAIQELKKQIGLLLYDEKGNLNRAGQMLNNVLGVVNTIFNAFGTAKTFLSEVLQKGPVMATYHAYERFRNPQQMIGLMPEFRPDLMQKNLLNPSVYGPGGKPTITGPSGSGMAGPTNVTVYVTNPDPKEVVRVIKAYARQYGALNTRTRVLGSY